MVAGEAQYVLALVNEHQSCADKHRLVPLRLLMYTLPAGTVCQVGLVDVHGLHPLSAPH